MTDNVTKIPRRQKCVDKQHPYIGGAKDVIDDDLQLTQAQINAIVLGGAVDVSLAASPATVFVGTEIAIALTATSSTPADTITIKKGDTTLATGSGTTLSGSDSLTPVEGNNGYTAQFVIGGLTKNTSKNVVGVYPIRIGTGAAYVEGTALTTPKTSPAGTYNVAVANNGDYVYFNVPSTMTIHSATMSGFDFPLESPVTVTIGGVEYKSYRSSNTYDAGTITVVLT